MGKSSNYNWVVIIPARLASKRLPRKPLIKILGKTIIERTYYQALKAIKDREKIIIATDSLAHRELPFQSSIDYFDLENKESFLNALNAALKKLNDNIQKDFSTLTLHHRMEKVINFITDSPEGLERS